MKNPDCQPEDIEPTEQRIATRFGKHQWIPYVLPMLVFMLAGQLEPKHPEQQSQQQDQIEEAAASHGETATKEDTANGGGFMAVGSYPFAYTIRIGLTLVAIGIAWPVYRAFPFRVSPLAIVVGGIGVMIWVGLCYVRLEEWVVPAPIAKWIGMDGSRAAFNPYQQFEGQISALIGFLAIRFFGLALVVPLIEEFFLRGFVARFVQDGSWWKLPIGSSAPIAWLAVIVYAVISHPGEMFAAAIWFSLVTWLVVKTKNIWDAVAAHAVTNLLLGIYVVSTDSWQLW